MAQATRSNRVACAISYKAKHQNSRREPPWRGKYSEAECSNVSCPIRVRTWPSFHAPALLCPLAGSRSKTPARDGISCASMNGFKSKTCDLLKLLSEGD